MSDISLVYVSGTLDREVAVLVKEVSGLKQMMEDIKETVAGLHLEDKGVETGSRVTTTGVSQDREETAGNSRTEDTDTGIEDEGEGRTEERTEICAGMMTGVSQDREETTGNNISEDTDTGIEDEGEGRTQVSRTRERVGQKRERRYVLGHGSWQPTHTRRTKRAL